MSEASRRRACASYDRMSRWYDLFSSMERKASEAGVRMLNAQKGERVLEIGPGTGRAVAALSKECEVVGLDISYLMLLEARKRAAGSTFIRGDAARPPLNDATFDAVFMSFTLELFDDADMAAVLAGCRMILKPGGRICVVAMAGEEKPGLLGRAYAWSHRTFPGIVDCRPIALKAVLSEAGFRVVEARRSSTYGLHIDVIMARV